MFMKFKAFSGILFSIVFISTEYNIIAQENPAMSIQWKPWEYNFTSSEPAAGRPVEVEVIFEGPSGDSFTGVAFTDDGIHYTIRAAFPEAGSWKWRIVSKNPDRSISHAKGNVEVIRYVGPNALYHHGDIRVSEDKRFLIHADGSPFLWMGDTGWNSTFNSTMQEWKTYVDTRSAQRFSVIQVNPRGTGNKNTASANPGVSFLEDGTPDTQFWKDLEDKIRYANEKGIIILLTGLGTAWRDTMAVNPNNQRFEDYIAGRMASLMVIFSPSFDQLFTDDLDKIAARLQKWTTHLVTQHPGTNINANLTFRSATSVDFTGLQSGHHGGDVTKAYAAARQWTLDLWGGTPSKPIILLESMYDAHGNNNAASWREKDARKTGWIAWMCGARGYSYGAGDVPPKVPAGHGAIWMFNKDTTTYDCWRNAVQWESAWQMTNLVDFFESVDWWNLIPSPELIRNQEQSDTLQMTAAKTGDFNLITAYLPDNEKIVLDLTMYYGSFSYIWYNPQTNRYQPAVRISGGQPNMVFVRPDGWEDAVLKIIKL